MKSARSMNLKLHVGHSTDHPGDVAIAVAPDHVERDDLAEHGPVIAMSPDSARKVASLIVDAADAAEVYRKSEGS